MMTKHMIYYLVHMRKIFHLTYYIRFVIIILEKVGLKVATILIKLVSKVVVQESLFNRTMEINLKQKLIKLSKLEMQ